MNEILSQKHLRRLGLVLFLILGSISYRWKFPETIHGYSIDTSTSALVVKTEHFSAILTLIYLFYAKNSSCTPDTFRFSWIARWSARSCVGLFFLFTFVLLYFYALSKKKRFGFYFTLYVYASNKVRTDSRKSPDHRTYWMCRIAYCVHVCMNRGYHKAVSVSNSLKFSMNILCEAG